MQSVRDPVPCFEPNVAGLVAVVNRRIDLELAYAERWYRIPVRSAPAGLDGMRWVAFYLTAPFGTEKWSVRYWAAISQITQARRVDLLPDESGHPRANEPYFRLALGPIQQRSDPIFSRRRRRLVFISSIWRKFVTALEINDLHDGSPLEDRLWSAFKQEGIEAERQWFEGTSETIYCMDFALFCPERNIDVECDGDSWHSNPARAREDNDRNNFLEQRGWHVLRFNTAQLMSGLPRCLQDVKKTIHRCGGLFLADGSLRPFDSLDARSASRSHNVLPQRVFSHPAESHEPMTLRSVSERSLRVDVAPLLAETKSKKRSELLAKLEPVHGSETVARALINVLSSFTPRERERAVWCLGKLQASSVAVDGLVACLSSEESRNVRRLAYSACAKLRSRRLEEVILLRIGEEYQQVLQYALTALEECGSQKSIEVIRRILSREQPEYVMKAAQAALRRCSLR